MEQPSVDRVVFVTLVRTAGERSCARILIDSIRSFGGSLSRSPIWLFEANPQEVPCGDFERMGVQVLPLNVPGAVRHYLYTAKVAACARAEELAGPGVQSLVFLAPENLIITPPLLFDLGGAFDVAARPVHIKNVGLDVAEPLDGFWEGVYRAVGVRDVPITVESFVDAQHIRAYFNSAAFSVNPSRGLFRQWSECFEALVCDQEFQSGPGQDIWHQVFLHQAVLSTLIATTVAPTRLRILPPDYVYPYNLHGSVPLERRARALNDLVCIYAEDRSLDPDVVDDVEIYEPLRSWLSTHANPNAG